jgi:hypothetical protein
MFDNAKLAEQCKIVTGYGPGTPSTTVADYVCLKNYGKCTVIIQALNASTVTGSAITLHQATAVANTNEKALAFSTMHANIDVAATDTLVATTVTSNTFTTDTVNTKGSLYVIDIPASSLDVASDFDCLCVKAATGVNTTLSVTYILSEPKYAKATPPSAIID